MEFEKYIKDNLSDQRSEIDASKMWDNVSNKIDFKKKKRKGIIFWISGLGMLSLLLVGFFSFPLLFKNKSIASQEIEIKNIEASTLLTDNVLQKNTSIDPIKIENAEKKETSAEVKTTKEIKNKATRTENKLTTAKTGIIQDQQSLLTNTYENNSNSITRKKELEISNPKTNINATEISKLFIGTSSTPRNNHSIDNNKDLSTSELTNELLENNIDQKSFTLKQSGISPNIPLLLPSLLEHTRETPSFSIKPTVKNTKQTFSTNPISVALVSAIGVTSRTLTSVDPMYQALRNSTEATLEHYNIQGKLYYHFNDRWAIGTGIDFLSQTEKIEWAGTYQENINGTYVDTIYYSTNTEFTTSNATGDYTATYQRDMRKYNQHQFINIPLSIQYHFHLKNHQFILEPQLLFNISYKAKGDYLNNFGVPSKLEELQTDCNIQYQLGLVYNYSITQNWNLNFGSSLRWAPQTSLGENAVKTESDYKFINLKIGVSRKF